MPLGAPLHTLSTLYDVPVGFVKTHYFEAVCSFICVRQRVAVARYRMTASYFVNIIWCSRRSCAHKILIHDKYFFYKIWTHCISFMLSKIDNLFFILILINVLEYEWNTKEISLSDNKKILLNIKLPCERDFSCSKVFCSKVKFIIKPLLIFPYIKINW